LFVTAGGSTAEQRQAVKDNPENKIRFKDSLYRYSFLRKWK
jgi:hypothetical protein